MKKLILLAVAVVFFIYGSRCEEGGKPFITTFNPVETGSHYQNWAVIQDERGIMYIGNGYGILEFDGVSWRLIALPNSSFVSSFSKDSTGRIFVGSASEVGYLAPGRNGETEYVSLLDQLPESERSFAYIQNIISAKDGVYFQCLEKLFRFRMRPSGQQVKPSWEVKIWQPESQNNYFRAIGYDQHTFLVTQQNGGILCLRNDSLNLFLDSPASKEDFFRYILPIPGKEGSWLLGCFKSGLLIYDGISVRPFITEADSLFKGVYNVVRILPDGTIGITTLNNGYLVIGQDGKLLQHQNKASGLISDVVRASYTDRQNNTWLAQDGGITILEYKSGISFYSQEGAIVDIFRYKGTLYLSTTNGLFYLDPGTVHFIRISQPEDYQCSFFCPSEGILYHITSIGIFRIDNRERNQIMDNKKLGYATLQSLLPLSTDKTRFLLGTMSGLFIVKKDPADKNKLILDRKVEEISENITRMVEAGKDTFWLSTYDGGAIRVTFSGKNTAEPVVKHFGPERGLPYSTTIVSKVAGKLIFSTVNGFMRYDEKIDRFLPDTFFSQLRMGQYKCESIAGSDKQGNIYVNGGKETVVFLRRSDGSLTIKRDLFARCGEQLLNALYFEENGQVWLGYSDGLVCYRPSDDTTHPVAWPAVIRKIRLADDSVLCPGQVDPNGSEKSVVKIPFRLNSLVFECSGLSYQKPELNQFSYKLEGFEKDWSTWARDTKRNYTNLPPGNYHFRVKSMNIYGQESSESSWEFSILTPWHRSLVALIGYILLGIVVVYGLIHYRTRNLRARSLMLEKTVRQRTAEIREQKNNVEQLSRIGRDITSSLSTENIIRTVYDNVNKVMDASVFTIGLYKPEKNILEFPAAIEKNQLMEPFSISLSDENRLGAWCFNHKSEVIINDYNLELKKYTGQQAAPIAGEIPESVLYLPLWNQNKVIGVISAQSFSKNSYSDYQVNILRNMATYCAIALENAEAYRRLAALIEELKTTQDRLVTQSKLAALGALTAGIAHEIKNPLNFINNFAGLNAELIEEIKSDILQEKNSLDSEELAGLKEILEMLGQNSLKIQEHGKRADSIVRNMLLHSRGGSGDRQLTDINALVEEAINLTYHGMRAQDKEFNIKIETSFDPQIGKMEVITQELSRAFLNILGNGCYEAYRKKRSGEADNSFAPKLTVTTRKLRKNVKISIRDNGNGVPDAVRQKLFTPFFTTKPTGQGTGLGLSISYDIVVHQHKGQLSFETEAGNFTEFTILLPCDLTQELV
jgi:signal transduction histidine kinase/ligand-binding sensor domain-containing protein